MEEIIMKVDASILFRMDNGLKIEWHADACACVNDTEHEHDTDWLARCLTEHIPVAVSVILAEHVEQ
jgi:hypothetical protein